MSTVHAELSALEPGGRFEMGALRAGDSTVTWDARELLVRFEGHPMLRLRHPSDGVRIQLSRAQRPSQSWLERLVGRPPRLRAILCASLRAPGSGRLDLYAFAPDERLTDLPWLQSSDGAFTPLPALLRMLRAARRLGAGLTELRPRDADAPPPPPRPPLPSPGPPTEPRHPPASFEDSPERALSHPGPAPRALTETMRRQLRANHTPTTYLVISLAFFSFAFAPLIILSQQEATRAIRGQLGLGALFVLFLVVYTGARFVITRRELADLTDLYTHGQLTLGRIAGTDDRVNTEQGNTLLARTLICHHGDGEASHVVRWETRGEALLEMRPAKGDPVWIITDPHDPGRALPVLDPVGWRRLNVERVTRR